MRVPDVPPWPGLAAFPVTVGGVTCTVAQAAEAAAVLAASRSSAIRALLRAAGSPLAACDYWAAAGPYLAAARASVAPTGRRGCAGRHVAKTAFCEALCAAAEAARAAFVRSAVAAFSADARYAAQMAADAVEIRRREDSRARARRLREAVEAAVSQCRAAGAGFGCALAEACGTGACRFAPAEFAALAVPAAPGRRPRPPGHAGGAFSEAPALAAWLAARPYKPRYTVHDADGAASFEEAA